MHVTNPDSLIDRAETCVGNEHLRRISLRQRTLQHRNAACLVCVRETSLPFASMPFRQTIAAKIFGLAIILLLLTIALAGFLLYEVTRTTEDLTVVANFDVPLT